MENNVVDLVIIGSLITLIFICILNFLFSNKNDKREVSKFVGGFSVALLAVYSREKYILCISIFIVGLIIASERFMSILIAFVSRNKEFLVSGNFEKMIMQMSPEEVRRKEAEEINEIIEIEKDETECDGNSDNGKSDLDKRMEYKELIPEIENKAIAKYQELTGFQVNRNVKFGDLMIDAIATNPHRTSSYLLEVKFFPRIKLNKNGSIKKSAILNSIKALIPHYLFNLERNFKDIKISKNSVVYLTFILVFNTDKNLNEMMESIRDVRQKYNKSDAKVIIKFIFYNLNKL
jgi:hypothetical protein